MKKSIDITEELYNKLASYAVGFDTPENVIQRLLDYYEADYNSQDSNSRKMTHDLSAVFPRDRHVGTGLQAITSASVEPESKRNLYEMIRKYETSNIKIGKLVQDCFELLFADKKISEEQIRLFHDKRYSKKVFDINFPLFVSKESETLDIHKRRRYYKEKYGDYFLCSQWLESSRDHLINWLRDSGFLDEVIEDLKIRRLI